MSASRAKKGNTQPSAAEQETTQETTQGATQGTTTTPTYGYQGYQGYASVTGRMGAYAMSGNFRVTNFTGNRATLQSVEQGYDGNYAFAHGSGAFEMTVGGEAYQALYDAYTNGQPVEWVFLVPKGKAGATYQTQPQPSNAANQTATTDSMDTTDSVDNLASSDEAAQ